MTTITYAQQFVLCVLSSAGLIQNITIEERVALLEIQVVEIEEDVAALGVDLTELGGFVDFLFDETVIQDERILTLEQTTDAINAELDTVDDDLEGSSATFIRPVLILK